MKIMIPENKTARTMLGDQKVKPGVYKPSQFNFILKDQEIMVFNTFTRMLSIVDEEEYALLQNNVSVSSAEEASPALCRLIEKRYFVPEGSDEAESYRQLYELIYMMRRPKDLSAYTILTTTACNARCFYCFEADFKPVTMDAKTAEDLADYIISHSKKENYVRLHWFGGEPLCNPKAMSIISNKLRDNGFTFGASVTSNGFLFDAATAKKAKEEWNVTIVQITLDGMNEEHNRRKNYAVQSKDPFELTIKNIHNLLDEGITVKVRLNFDMNNLQSIKDLTVFLKNEFGKEENFVAYPAVLFEDCNAWNPDRLPEEQQALLKELFKLRDEMEEQRIFFAPALNRDLPLERCGANNRGHRDITPDGKFTVCHNVGDADTYGSIYEGITDKEKYERWMNNSRIAEKCRDCRWLPECTGFDQCPIRRSTCRQEEEDMMGRKLRKEYRKYMKKLKAEEAEA